jgi:hypothetical protein
VGGKGLAPEAERKVSELTGGDEGEVRRRGGVGVDLIDTTTSHPSSPGVRQLRELLESSSVLSFNSHLDSTPPRRSVFAAPSLISRAFLRPRHRFRSQSNTLNILSGIAPTRQ